MAPSRKRLLVRVAIVFGSLVERRYEEVVGDYLKRQVLSVVTIRPDATATFDDAAKVYAEGVVEMWRVKQRLDLKAAARAP